MHKCIQGRFVCIEKNEHKLYLVFEYIDTDSDGYHFDNYQEIEVQICPFCFYTQRNNNAR
jgi:hypothetical protein